MRVPGFILCLAAATISVASLHGQELPQTPATSGRQRVTRPLAEGRPLIGVAFGGGSARGIAHVGVIRWFEEHKIPIDLAAGTSMGGLLGGAFAMGMSASEIQSMLAEIDWDRMFGSSSFPFKNIRRKTDNRAFPSRLEFGIKRGLASPPALNNGEEVELLIDRLTAPYYALAHFDDLPTPFRTVAVDLVSGSEVVLDRGALPIALRSTMSLPLIFPPVDIDGRVLVDGGLMNNIPADVVRDMGATRVIAINVGDLTERQITNYSLLGVANATLDAMMRASTTRALADADVVLNVPLKEFSSLDWRRTPELIQAGYDAAEAIRDRLLAYAVSDAEFAQWQRARAERRLRTLPIPAFVALEGFASSDARRLQTTLADHAGVPLDVARLERDLAALTGLDRYETVTWRLSNNDAGQTGLSVTAHPKPNAPPFMMLGLNVENTTSSDFRVDISGKYLAYGWPLSGSELRIDGTIGSFPAVGIELYEPLRATPLFVAPYASVTTDSAASLSRDQILAKYRITTSRLGFDVGVNLGTRSDLRVGGYWGRLDASLQIGDPSLPELQGSESGLQAVWRFDGQDSPVVPSGGTHAMARLLRVLDGPDGVLQGERVAIDARITQLAGTANQFWSLGEKNRLFLYGGLGTSFGEQALAPYTFALGSAFRMGAYRLGELRSSNYYIASGGYMRQVGRLPDFMGGPVFVGGWLENGDAFADWSQAHWRTNASGSLIMDTLVGPVVVAGSAGFDRRWRTYIGVGRVFR